MFRPEKLFWNIFFPTKTLQIRRDLVFSFLRHIFKLSGSNSEIQNFSSNGSDKSEKSMLTMEIIDFLPGFYWSRCKTIKFWTTLIDIFLSWGQHRWSHKYFVHVFGVITCFFIELSKPIFDFRFFHNIFLVFWKKVLSETKCWKIHENMSKIATGNWENFQKYQKILWKNRKSKIGFDSSIKKTCENPQNVNKILIPSPMLSSTQKNVEQSFSEFGPFRTRINGILVENQWFPWSGLIFRFDSWLCTSAISWILNRF